MNPANAPMLTAPVRVVIDGDAKTCTNFAELLAFVRGLAAEVVTAIDDRKAKQMIERDKRLRLGAALAQVRTVVPGGVYIRLLDHLKINRKTAYASIRTAEVTCDGEGKIDLVKAAQAAGVTPDQAAGMSYRDLRAAVMGQSAQTTPDQKVSRGRPNVRSEPNNQNTPIEVLRTASGGPDGASAGAPSGAADDDADDGDGLGGIDPADAATILGGDAEHGGDESGSVALWAGDDLGDREVGAVRAGVSADGGDAHPAPGSDRDSGAGHTGAAVDGEPGVHPAAPAQMTFEFYDEMVRARTAQDELVDVIARGAAPAGLAEEFAELERQHRAAIAKLIERARGGAA